MYFYESKEIFLKKMEKRLRNLKITNVKLSVSL